MTISQISFEFLWFSVLVDAWFLIQESIVIHLNVFFIGFNCGMPLFRYNFRMEFHNDQMLAIQSRMVCVCRKAEKLPNIPWKVVFFDNLINARCANSGKGEEGVDGGRLPSRRRSFMDTIVWSIVQLLLHQIVKSAVSVVTLVQPTFLRSSLPCLGGKNWESYINCRRIVVLHSINYGRMQWVWNDSVMGNSNVMDQG